MPLACMANAVDIYDICQRIRWHLPTTSAAFAVDNNEECRAGASHTYKKSHLSLR